MGVTRHLSARAAIVLSAVLSAAVLGHAQAPQAPAGGAAAVAAMTPPSAALWTAFDADKDGAVTRAEMKSAFAKWYDATDTAKSGSGDDRSAGPALNTALALPAPAPRARRRRPRRRCAGASRVRRAAGAAICRRSDRRRALKT